MVVCLQQRRQRVRFSPRLASQRCSWRQAHARLQEFHLRRSEQAAVRAGVAWHHYGEQPTFYFHHLTHERREATTVRELQLPRSPTPTPLTTHQAVLRAGEVLHDSFSGDAAQGLFRLRSTDTAAQDRLLASLDVRLPPVLTELGFACLAFNRRGHDILSIRDSRAPEGGALQLTREAIADNDPSGTPSPRAASIFAEWLILAGPTSREPVYLADVADNFDVFANTNKDLFELFDILDNYIEIEDEEPLPRGTFIGLPLVS